MLTTQSQTFSLATKPRRDRELKNYEGFVVVWLNTTQNCVVAKHTEVKEKQQYELQKFVSRLENFDDPDQCVDYITDIKNEKVFLIVSGCDGILPLIREIQQIEKTYIFSVGEDANHQDVYTDTATLSHQLRIDTQRSENDMLGIEVISSSGEEHAIHRQEPTFMYAQFIKELLLNWPTVLSGKADMVTFYREIYADSKSELSKLDEFEAKYTCQQAIQWYTKDCFLYRMLNNALRSLDTKVLLKMQFYLADLNAQITEQHSKWCAFNPNVCKLTVYRGLVMPVEAFEPLKRNVGGFMSVTYFLSTTRDRNVAAMYAGDHTTAMSVAIVLEIEIDARDSKIPFTDISIQSQFGDEQEILFTMGAIFRILSVHQNIQSIWIVKTKLTDEQDEELRKLAEHMRKKIMRYSHPVLNWGPLLLEMGKYAEAQQYYVRLIDLNSKPSDDELLSDKPLASFHNQLGLIYDEMGQTEDAKKQYLRSLELKQRFLPDTDHSFGSTFHNLAVVYVREGDYEKALQYYEKAVNTELNSSEPHQETLALYFNSIGLTYSAQKRYSESLDKFQKALEMQLDILPADDPTLGTCYHNIGCVYHAQRDYAGAEDYLKKCLRIQERSLPPEHVHFARTHYNLSRALDEQHKFAEALDHKRAAFRISSTALSLNHPDTLVYRAGLQSLESALSYNRGDYDSAIIHGLSALETQMKSSPVNHYILAMNHWELSRSFHSAGKLVEALDHARKCHESRARAYSPDHSYTLKDQEWLAQLESEFNQAQSQKAEKPDLS